MFEWLGWYNPVIPKWMSPADLARNGFNIDTSHVPFMDVKKLNVEESVDEFYTRNANFVKYALRKHEPEGKENKFWTDSIWGLELQDQVPHLH